MIERMSFNKRQKLELLLFVLLLVCSIGSYFSRSDGQSAVREPQPDVSQTGTKKTGTVGRTEIVGADLARGTEELHDPFSMEHENRQQVREKAAAAAAAPAQPPAQEDPPMQQPALAPPTMAKRGRRSYAASADAYEPVAKDPVPALPVLKGVVSGTAVPFAILALDGRQEVVRTGDWIGDWHILSISDAGAAIEEDGRTFWLDLP